MIEQVEQEIEELGRQVERLVAPERAVARPVDQERADAIPGRALRRHLTMLRPNGRPGNSILQQRRGESEGQRPSG